MSTYPASDASVLANIEAALDAYEINASYRCMKYIGFLTHPQVSMSEEMMELCEAFSNATGLGRAQWLESIRGLPNESEKDFDNVTQQGAMEDYRDDYDELMYRIRNL